MIWALLQSSAAVAVVKCRNVEYNPARLNVSESSSACLPFLTRAQAQAWKWIGNPIGIHSKMKTLRAQCMGIARDAAKSTKLK